MPNPVITIKHAPTKQLSCYDITLHNSNTMIPVQSIMWKKWTMPTKLRMTKDLARQLLQN